MEPDARKKLKHFINNNIPFYELKKAGFFKEIRKTDYEKIAERVCHYFGYKNIYEYKPVCRGIKCNGNCGDPSEYCKSFGPLKWRQLEVNHSDIISKDSWLN